MLKCSTPYPKVIHSLSTQKTDLSTAYTQLVHTLFYPISTLAYNAYSGVTIHVAISPQPLDCSPIVAYTILIQ